MTNITLTNITLLYVTCLMYSQSCLKLRNIMAQKSGNTRAELFYLTVQAYHLLHWPTTFLPLTALAYHWPTTGLPLTALAYRWPTAGLQLAYHLLYRLLYTLITTSSTHSSFSFLTIGLLTTTIVNKYLPVACVPMKA